MNVPENHSPSVADSMEAPMEPPLPFELTPLGQLNERALGLVRERPIMCLVGALTLGFVVGKIAARY